MAASTAASLYIRISCQHGPVASLFVSFHSTLYQDDNGQDVNDLDWIPSRKRTGHSQIMNRFVWISLVNDGWRVKCRFLVSNRARCSELLLVTDCQTCFDNFYRNARLRLVLSSNKSSRSRCLHCPHKRCLVAATDHLCFLPFSSFLDYFNSAKFASQSIY